jgi:Family of unknown function (DUF5996)
MLERWPSLPWQEWQDTANTLHMWMQIVGKTKLALTPLRNHWWNVTFQLSARGLTTGSIPYNNESFEIQFDFLEHRLVLAISTGQVASLALRPQSVADFYQEYLAFLHRLGIDVKIWAMPVEIPDPIPFTEDRKHASYDAASVTRFWRILQQSDGVFRKFEVPFLGKASPVHFFWGSLDLAVTRFSGRPAPERAGADSITREAYSHEVISAGFWPGKGFGEAAFYCYAAPEPAGLAQKAISPKAAFYSSQLKEFLLKYEDLRSAASPEDELLSFLNSTYEAAADLAGWDRVALERGDSSAS